MLQAYKLEFAHSREVSLQKPGVQTRGVQLRGVCPIAWCQILPFARVNRDQPPKGERQDLNRSTHLSGASSQVMPLQPRVLRDSR